MTSSATTSPQTVRLGSRKSQLALVQSEWVQAQLQAHHPDTQFEIETMSTQGDKILDVPLAKIGDKGLFTKELEVGMLARTTDMAVHSLKDLPTNLPEGLMLGCVTERENPADALVVNAKYGDKKLETLPDGAVVGTSSLRRLAQLRHYFPQLAFKDVRGNLNTRLKKLDDGEYDALILAAAGLKRLEMSDRIQQEIPSDISLHAVGQGALGIECRQINDQETEENLKKDRAVLEIIQVIQHQPTLYRCLAERAFLRSLEGGCQVPIGVNTSIEGDRLTLVGMVASLDGQHLIRDQITGSCQEAEQLGTSLAEELRGRGAGEILAEILAQVDRS